MVDSDTHRAQDGEAKGSLASLIGTRRARVRLRRAVIGLAVVGVALMTLTSGQPETWLFTAGTLCVIASGGIAIGLFAVALGRVRAGMQAWYDRAYGRNQGVDRVRQARDAATAAAVAAQWAAPSRSPQVTIRRDDR